MIIISDLIKIAEQLDTKGLFKEANEIDYLLLKLAMTSEEARKILDIPFGASDEEVNKSFRTKALQMHPDVGGSTGQMQQLNIARDILLGERKEEVPRKPEYSSEYKPQPSKPWPEKVVVSFEDAARAAGVPGDVEWKFKTDTGYSPPLGDKKTSGFVVCGKKEGRYIFAGVFHWREENFFSHVDIDRYEIHIAGATDIDASTVAIRDLWGNFEHLKGWNGKVIILSPGTEFNESLFYAKGRSVAFKDALGIMESKPISEGRKIDISLELSSNPDSFSAHLITLVVNGRPFELGDEISKLLTEKSNFIRFVFGQYAYDHSKKNITKMREKSKVLGYLVKKLEGKVEPELMDALQKAFEQAA
ncbi:MAG: J domain-containing protein [Patescibacteria group bacterium]